MKDFDKFMKWLIIFTTSGLLKVTGLAIHLLCVNSKGIDINGLHGMTLLHEYCGGLPC